uniref:Uncharacterized protein n=1 Tax=Nyssomyia neivai TaxID=330878 RepID=A0A1L8D7D8_9DIPT
MNFFLFLFNHPLFIFFLLFLFYYFFILLISSCTFNCFNTILFCTLLVVVMKCISVVFLLWIFVSQLSFTCNGFPL